MVSWIFSPNIKTVHGFSTRHGGVSEGAFASLNFGAGDDKPELIIQNKMIALGALKINHEAVCSVKQVHGNRVIIAERGIQEADALVSNEPGVPIAIGVADCYPILYHDPVNKVIGAAHAGWRGTVTGIAGNTVEEMVKLGAVPGNIQVAIGQGISTDRFEVGPEVIEEFKKNDFPINCIIGNHIDLISANIHILEKSGIKSQNIWSMNRCTFESDFFSYRRDKGKTGRMWAIIML